MVTMSDGRWRWVARGAVLWYCLWAILFIQAKPGFHYDEAIDVLGSVHLRHSHADLTLPHSPDTWFCVKKHCFPLMSAPYIGAIKEYICLPLFAILGPRAEVVRLVAMTLGALGIIGIATLLGRQVSYPVAAAAAWAMAIHPSYLDMTVLDNSAFSPWMGAFGLLCIAASRYLDVPNPRTAFWVGATVGLGVWARANYVWLLAALFAALVISAGRRLLLPFSHWAFIVVGGLIGGLPFLVYQALSRGGTWEAAGMFPASGTLTERSLHRLWMLSETLFSDGEHQRIWDGPALPEWQLWLFPTVIAVSCLVCLIVKQRHGFLPRTAALTLLIFTGVFFSTSITVAEHHLVTLVPIAVMVVALAGWELMHRTRWARASVIAVAAVYAGSAVYGQFATLNGLRRTGGVGPWSDGIFELTKRLRADFPGQELKVLDWGLQNNVYVLSDGRVRTREHFGRATVDKTDWNVQWIEEIRRGGVFLLNGPQNRQIPAASTGFLRALAEGRPTMRRYTVPQRSGVPYAEVIEIVPDTLGTGPAPPPDPPVPIRQEIAANDPAFSERSTGFYGIEKGSWRWTKQEFSLTFPSSPAARLTLHVNVPEPVIQRLGAITMSIRAGAHVLGPETFSRPGDYTVTRSLEPGNAENRFDFRLDKALGPSAADGRALGIIFVSASLDSK
jgi:hypothetical protein